MVGLLSTFIFMKCASFGWIFKGFSNHWRLDAFGWMLVGVTFFGSGG